ncbi:MAG: tRNA (adenosine(37)-N6)-threonylcarbamoyltransferase complex transferase subunit TsaD [Omnitrophica WOR_2 bacterium RIFCSPLOWO2_01_FULL_41_12]|nr:MAG: tRNA (adenosine(37)-N6)-threonylcarbamoyltransferase complex transferase subunit TsaD [Omnitrophica WOR_2 bacterium RIFCSPLOWO2_01_FULL_41_12]
MYVLGIETSCDETAVSVVKDGRKILSNVVASSLTLHKKYGGVVPEIASRMQLETITAVADSAITKAGLKLKDIDLISVTASPGLLGSLLVGISFAKSLSLSLEIPLLGINHLYSHIYASFLNGLGTQMPFVALIVSGGHTSLFYVQDFHRIKLIGQTLDDACGEAFDKVAKILGLGYPGGPLIERLAEKGNPKSISFRCSNTKNPLDFSFSGIKTAVLYKVKSQKLKVKIKKDIAAAFQEVIIDTLIKKAFLACKLKRTNRLVIGGGVAANNRLRERFYRQAKEKKIRLSFAPKELCMDNAAMVAGLGFKLFKNGGEYVA